VRPLLVLAYARSGSSPVGAPDVTDVLNGDAAGGDYTGTIFALAGLVLTSSANRLFRSGSGSRT
jgi:hypothetical protein